MPKLGIALFLIGLNGLFAPSERRDYETVARLGIGELQHMPETGEAVETMGWRFEVIDLDGRRIDKVLASRVENREAA